MVSFIAAVAFATNFINNIYYKWINSPVILSLSPEATPINTIPFPAITICNMNNAKRSVALDILNRYVIQKILLISDYPAILQGKHP